MAVSICLIALDENARLSDEGIPKAWAARWPTLPQPTDGEKSDTTLSYRVGDHQVIYGLMPAPIPWSDLEPVCANAVFWPDAASEMRKHKKHVIVTVLGNASRIEEMKVLTQATIAFTDSTEGAIGVCWFHSSQVLPPATFTEIACQFIPNGLPLPLWVNFCITRNPDGSSAGFTRGLEAFDLLEFETTKSPEPPEELRNRLLGLADYVIRSGSVIKDGDTIGEDKNEKIKVTYGPSSFGAEGDVMRLDYDGSRTPKLKMTTYGCLHAVATLLCTIAFGYFLYTFFPFLRDSFFRHVLLIPIILVFGFLLLVISDRILQKTLGLEAFDSPKE